MSSELARTESTGLPPAFNKLEGGDDLWTLFLLDKADLTRENYARDLRAFAGFLGVPTVAEAVNLLVRCSGPDAHTVIIRYLGYLTTVPVHHGGEVRVGYAPKTIHRRIYALRSVIELGRTAGVIPWKLGRIRLPAPDPVRSTRGPGPDGYAAVLEALDQAIAKAGSDRDRQLALRDRVLLRLLHDSGLRRAEVVGIEFPRGVRLTDDPSVLVLSKGKRRHQWVPISAPCAEAIRAYLDARGQRAGYLIRGTGKQARGKMDRSTVNRRAHRWATVAGVAFTPHGLRHTAITSVLDEVKGDLRIAARWSRHQSLASLRPYDDRRRQDDRRLTEFLSDPDAAEPHS